MAAHPKLRPEAQMTVEEFLAFAESRPEEERWELIEGVPVMNPSPVRMHQMVAMNIGAFLSEEKQRLGAGWLPLLGVGTIVPASPNSLPQPDVYVQEAGLADASPVTDDALVVFEVISRANRRADRDWRRRIYPSIPNCQHYVTVSLKAPEVVAYDRASGWRERRLKGLEARLELAALGVVMPLLRIYRWTPLGGAQ